MAIQTINNSRLNIKIKLGDTISLNIRQLIIEFYLDSVTDGEYLFNTITPTPRWNEPKYPERLATLLFCTGKGSTQGTEYIWQTPNECNIANYTLPSTRIVSELPITTTTSTTTSTDGSTNTTTTSVNTETGSTTTTTQTTTSTGTTTTTSTTTNSDGSSSTASTTTTGTTSPPSSPVTDTSTTQDATSYSNGGNVAPSTSPESGITPTPTINFPITTAPITTQTTGSTSTGTETTSTGTVTTVTPTPTPTPTPFVPENAETTPPSGSVVDADQFADANIPGFTEEKQPGVSRANILKNLIKKSIVPFVRSALARKRAQLSEKLKKEREAFNEQKKLAEERLRLTRQSTIEGGTVLTYPLSGSQTPPTSSVEIPRVDPATLPTSSAEPSASAPPAPADVIKTKTFYFIYEAGQGFKERGGFNAITTNFEDNPTIPQSGIYVFAEGGVYDYYFNGNLVDTTTGPNIIGADDTTIVPPEALGLTLKGLRTRNAAISIANFICTNPEKFGGLQPGCDTNTYRLPESSFKVNPTPADTDSLTLYKVLTKIMRDTRNDGFDDAVLRFSQGVPQGLLDLNNANFRSIGYVVDEAKFQLPQYIQAFNNKAKNEKINSVSSDKSDGDKSITQFVLTPLETLTTPTSSASPPPTTAGTTTSSNTSAATNPRIQQINQRVAEIDTRLSQIRTEIEQISRIAQTDDTALDRFEETITRLQNEDRTLRAERTALLNEKQTLLQG